MKKDKTYYKKTNAVELKGYLGVNSSGERIVIYETEDGAFEVELSKALKDMVGSEIDLKCIKAEL